jgi:hypothetical protein
MPAFRIALITRHPRARESGPNEKCHEQQKEMARMRVGPQPSDTASGIATLLRLELFFPLPQIKTPAAF